MKQASRTSFPLAIDETGRRSGRGTGRNFTYMWALQSKIGFIVDIRRQNMPKFSAEIPLELSPDRADFMANPFSGRH